MTENNKYLLLVSQLGSSVALSPVNSRICHQLWAEQAALLVLYSLICRDTAGWSLV